MLSSLAWLSVWSKLHVISIWSSLYHSHPVISCIIEIQNRLSFWYHLTQVIPEKRPWNECLCFFYFNHVCRRFLAYHCKHFYVNIRNPLSNRNFLARGIPRLAIPAVAEFLFFSFLLIESESETTVSLFCCQLSACWRTGKFVTDSALSAAHPVVSR